MKFLKGKNWFEIKFGKNGRKGFFSGPLYHQEQGAEGKYRYHLYSFMTRRFKFRAIKDRELKKWEISLGGMWSSEGHIDEYINYTIKVSRFTS